MQAQQSPELLVKTKGQQQQQKILFKKILLSGFLFYLNIYRTFPNRRGREPKFQVYLRILLKEVSSAVLILRVV